MAKRVLGLKKCKAGWAMDERVLQARVGIVVISSLLLTAILVVLVGDSSMLFQSGKEISITFPSAPGVKKGTPVRKSGILVGRVEEVQLVKGSSDVVVRVILKKKAELYRKETVRVGTATLLGDAVLEFVPGDDKLTGLIKDGASLHGEVAANPLELMSSVEGDLQKTLSAVTSASNEFSQLAGRLNKMMGQQDDGQLPRLADKTEATLDAIRTAMENVNDVIGDEKTRNGLRQAMTDMPKILGETSTAIEEMRGAVARADTNLQNLEGLTGPLGQRGTEIAERLDSSVRQFDEVMTQLVTFTDRLNSGDGSLGKLINDPELYQNLNKAATNIRQLTTDFKPIVNNFNVFSSKLARDPGLVGVSGAIRRNSRSKYPNFKFDEPSPEPWREDLRPPTNWREPLK